MDSQVMHVQASILFLVLFPFRLSQKYWAKLTVLYSRSRLSVLNIAVCICLAYSPEDKLRWVQGQAHLHWAGKSYLGISRLPKGKHRCFSFGGDLTLALSMGSESDEKPVSAGACQRAQSRVLGMQCGDARARLWLAGSGARGGPRVRRCPPASYPAPPQCAERARRQEAAGAPRPAPRGASRASAPTARAPACALPLSPRRPGRHGERALRGETPQLPAAAARASLDRGLISAAGASSPRRYRLAAQKGAPASPAARRLPARALPPRSCGVKASPLERVPPSPGGNFRTRPSRRPFKFPTLATCRWSEGKRPFSASPGKGSFLWCAALVWGQRLSFPFSYYCVTKATNLSGVRQKAEGGSQHRRLGKTGQEWNHPLSVMYLCFNTLEQDEGRW